jgi:hypothetical protein
MICTSRAAVKAAAAVALAAAALLASAGAASAEEPTQFGFNMNKPKETAITGNDGACSGVVSIALDVDQAKPGWLSFILTPVSATGEGADWEANPVCRFATDIYSRGMFDLNIRNLATVEFAVPPAGADAIRTDVFFGSGMFDYAVVPVGAPAGGGGFMHSVIVP